MGWAAVPLALLWPSLAVTGVALGGTAPAVTVLVVGLKLVGLAGLAVALGLALRLLPPRPSRHGRRRWVAMVAHRALVPVTSVAYGAGSALAAQSRLVLGRRLETFDVTEKTVVTEAGTRVT